MSPNCLPMRICFLSHLLLLSNLTICRYWSTWTLLLYMVSRTATLEYNLRTVGTVTSINASMYIHCGT